MDQSGFWLLALDLVKTSLGSFWNYKSPDALGLKECLLTLLFKQIYISLSVDGQSQSKIQWLNILSNVALVFVAFYKPLMSQTCQMNAHNTVEEKWKWLADFPISWLTKRKFYFGKGQQWPPFIVIVHARHNLFSTFANLVNCDLFKRVLFNEAWYIVRKSTLFWEPCWGRVCEHPGFGRHA